MMHEYEDDFFFEEDKMYVQLQPRDTQLLLLIICNIIWVPLLNSQSIWVSLILYRKYSEPITQRNNSVDPFSNLHVSLDLLSVTPSQLQTPFKNASVSEKTPSQLQLPIELPTDDASISEKTPSQLRTPVEDASVFENKNDKVMDNEFSLETECIYNDLRQERYLIQYQDLMGMMVTSGSVVLTKDDKNLIGISIGGGAPLCPCLYIVQIFDGTPASKEGTLQSGDELTGVNGQSVKGKTKVEVAKMIQSAKDDVIINYNKLHADPKQGKSLDLIMKKMKHRLVENMSSGTADALGLSRAILCNDTLVAKLNELRGTETMYKRLVEHAKRMLKSYFDLLQTYKALGDVFAAIGVREPQPRASEAFSRFANYHRHLEKQGISMLKALKPILADMGTYLNKAIPDTKLTIRKYADTKFEYLSYCLKVKEMDDEEHGYNALQEPLYRLETGNYEYRLILRCRQDARARFARLRADVLVKLELLDSKRAQDVAYQLRRFIHHLAVYQEETGEQLRENSTLFPVEVDLSQNAFQYKSTTPLVQDNPEDEEDLEVGREIVEHYDMDQPKYTNRRTSKEKDLGDNSQEQLLPGFDAPSEEGQDNFDDISLLTELGLADTMTPKMNEEFGDFQNGMGSADVDVFDKLMGEIGQ